MNEMAFSSLPNGSFILASASLTRAKMLRDSGVEHDLLPVAIDEVELRQTAQADDMSPEDIAIMLAEMKARAAVQVRAGVADTKPAYILGCDQILSSDSGVLGKPASLDDARRQLLSLAGKTHQLLTAAVLFKGEQRIWHFLARAKMTMRKFDQDFVDSYLAALGETALKTPASYQIEGLGAQLFQQIEGCHYAILGLPLLELMGFLREHGLAPQKEVT